MLETTRLLLRAPSIDDLDDFIPLLGDREVARYLLPNRPLTPKEVATALELSIARLEADGFGLLTVESKDDHRIIGRSGLIVWETDPWIRTARAWARRPIEIELGSLVAREFWGQGFATEAGLAVRAWAFEELDVERLVGVVHPENVAGMKVAEHFGMRSERLISASGSARMLYAVHRD